jgi:hypothetical protein
MLLDEVYFEDAAEPYWGNHVPSQQNKWAEGLIGQEDFVGWQLKKAFLLTGQERSLSRHLNFGLRKEQHELQLLCIETNRYHIREVRVVKDQIKARSLLVASFLDKKNYSCISTNFSYLETSMTGIC